MRPPLGALYRGSCVAKGIKAEPPDADTLSSRCNFGYARLTCGCFPNGPGPDAVRFSIAKDDGRRVDIRFTVEQDHRPERHGRLEFDREGETWSGVEADTVLYDQAQAYLKSYLSWRSRSAAV